LIRLGLLGGTFDPPHYGHLLLANEAAWQLRLERVLFLPARQNPLKRGEPTSPAEARCEMVQLAIADNARFELSLLDLGRPPPSFTVDLLRTLAAPDHELFFLAGGDILPELPHWHATAEILKLARLVIAMRPGAPRPDTTQLERQLPGISSRVDLLRTPGLEISSTQLRERVKAGQPIRYMTPPEVERYILDNRLYV
jgi:nicotinate-nucleotide adenylyltransferase